MSQDPFLPSPDEPVSEEAGLSQALPPVQGRRVLWGLLLWAGLTLGALLLAWSWPDATLLHFWLVAQAVPVLYWLLIAWVIRSPSRGRHVS